MRVLGEIPAQATPALRAGTLRGRDLAAFGDLLAELGDVRTVLLAGEPVRRRQAAIGLATTAAAAGTSTVLVESDLEKPALAQELGLTPAPGLREYLSGEADASRILEPVALAGPGTAAALDPLVCIVAGRSVSGARALLCSERFRHAAARLRNGYELVVLDGLALAGDDGTTPSVGGEDRSLAALAAEADATLACVARSDPDPEIPVRLDGLVVHG